MPFVRIIAAIALLLCGALVATSWHEISAFSFRDPDDALRYVEARDFVMGQSWFDVSQHRINPPVGGPMHWSRIVDLPIAALMLLLRPLLGAVMADKMALATVPLVLVTALSFMVALAVRRLSDSRSAVVATALIATSMPILIQFMPMRVDHHGWQILMAAVALWAAFDDRPRGGGIITGVAVAFWLHISSEGLPYAALFGGIFAIWFIRDEQAWQRLVFYAAALVVGSAVLLLGTRGWAEAAKPYCDALSSVYLLPMAVATAALPVSRFVIGDTRWQRRVAICGVAGTVALLAYLANGGACLSGPFGTLDPIVYKYWYLNVAEGRPVWEQPLGTFVALASPPLIGMAGMMAAIYHSRDADSRFRWLSMLLIAGGAYAVSLLVMRAMSVAYVMALPGMAWLLLMLLPRARGLKSAPARIIATAALCGVTPIGVSVLVAAALPNAESPASVNERAVRSSAGCNDRSQLVGLADLRRGTIMAPLDLGPHLLAFTPHNVVATAHHRNDLAMRDAMLSFMNAPGQARVLMARHRVTYVAYCPGTNEVANYVKLGPHGLMQSLESGKLPYWLTRVPIRRGETIRVYRLSYAGMHQAPGANFIAAPFMQ